MEATHSIDWFEIPARDIDRAQRFYETLLAAPMRRETIAGQRRAVRVHDAVACLTACSQRCMRSAASARDSVGRKVRSTCHCDASSSRLR